MSAPEHQVVTAAELTPPRGYAHAVVAAPGKLVHLGGQTAQGRDGSIHAETMVEQFDVAAANLITALRAAGGEPHHLVAMQIFVTDVAAYRASVSALREVWRSRFGARYPAIALIGVSELFDPAALIEMTGVAVMP